MELSKRMKMERIKTNIRTQFIPQIIGIVIIIMTFYISAFADNI